MMKLTQTQIAKRAGISQPMVNAILNGKARPSWKAAKRLIEVFPSTDYLLWLEGTPEQIRAAIDNGLVQGDSTETECKINAA